jgi:AraC-like DNA-binding protein
MSTRNASAAPNELYISAAYAFLVLDVVRRWGVTAQDLLSGIGLDERTIESPDARLSVDQVAALIGRARALTNEPGLGILIGLVTHTNTFGFLSFASQSAATLGESIELTIRYSPVITTLCSFRLNRVDGIAGLVVDEHCPHELGDARDVLLLGALVGVRMVGCTLTGRQPWRPIDVAMPEPSYYRRLAHLVPELRFDQPISQIVLLESDLDLPLLTPDRAALRLAKERCEDNLRMLGIDAAVEQRALCVVLKQDGPLSFDKVALALGLSPRTFKRRLAEAGVTFSEIVEKARRERALLLLRSPSVPLDEVAERLGYSTVSNLVRAFRRWTGMTPAAYRRQVSGRLSVHLPLRR